MAMFYCRECNNTWEDRKPRISEFMDPIYGPCRQAISVCPSCGTDCTEKPVLRETKKPGSSYRMDTCGPACGSNCCPGCN